MRLSFICSPGVFSAWLCTHQSVTGPVTRSTYGARVVSPLHPHFSSTFAQFTQLLFTMRKHSCQICLFLCIMYTVGKNTLWINCHSRASRTCMHCSRPVALALPPPHLSLFLGLSLSFISLSLLCLLLLEPNQPVFACLFYLCLLQFHHSLTLCVCHCVFDLTTSVYTCFSLLLYLLKLTEVPFDLSNLLCVHNHRREKSLQLVWIY